MHTLKLSTFNLLARLHTYRSTCLSDCLPACLPAYLLVCKHASLPVWLAAHLPACLLTCPCVHPLACSACPCRH